MSLRELQWQAVHLGSWKLLSDLGPGGKAGGLGCIAAGCGERGRQRNRERLHGLGFLFEGADNVLELTRWWLLCNFVSLIQSTDLHTLKGQVDYMVRIYNMCSISQFLKF